MRRSHWADQIYDALNVIGDCVSSSRCLTRSMFTKQPNGRLILTIPHSMDGLLKTSARKFSPMTYLPSDI